MTPGQQAGLDDLVAAFGRDRVATEDLDNGRLWVTLRSVDVGAGWTVPVSDLSTVIEVTYPSPPPYPFYAVDGLAREDGSAISGLTSSVDILGRRRAQLSLKKDGQTGLVGLSAQFMAVVAWLRSR